MATIAVDADDVLVAHFEILFAHLNATFGSDVSAADWHARYRDVRAYARDWAVSVEEVAESVGALLEREGPIAEPLPGAVEALTRLAEEHELVVLSARHQPLREVTLAWLETHLPGVFDDVHLVGGDRWGDGLVVDKVQTLGEIGATVLVDDNLRHCVAAAGAGVRAILFGEYGWNRADPLPPGVERAADWRAVHSLLA